MKPARIDPRIVRTRTALREGLETLLRDRSFEELTLNDIAKASGLNRATIYKHHPDKFALLDALVSDELQTRLFAATSGGEWAGATKLAAVIRAACQCLQWVGSLGRQEDRLLRPIAEARVRTLLLRVIEYGLSEKLVVAVGKPELAAAMASAAIYGAAEAWASSGATSPRALDTYVAKVIAALASTLVPNPHPPPRSNRPLKFE
ncbi:TetR/AcrR family transcriptional regulator [Pendulispora rubella]|uniref:TetR/AcrR family transcriptional regulator n=1 Tax=Pendulispora rubella TaxID=2741070 RepID=A0ABZ2L734_9BACT